MLKRIVTVVALVVLWAVLTTPLASADSKQICNEHGNCWYEEVGSSSGGGSGSPGDDSDGGRSKEEATVCKDEGRVIPCETKHGTWSSTFLCYLEKIDPQPPFSDPLFAGRTYGALYYCGGPGYGSTNPVVWLDTAPELPPPDPEVLAWRALAAVKLKPIDLGIAPEPREANSASLGAVGLPVWLWADSTSPSTTGPISSTASERGYTVSITARLSDIEWDLGDGGKTISCGIGTRFDPATMDPTTPVVCGRQSGYQKQGEYTITATSHWEVSWSGIGESGTIDYDRTTSGTVRIGEIQVVVRGR